MGDMQWPSDALVVLASTFDGFDLPEILDNPVKEPLLSGVPGPVVVVGGEPAHPHHRIHRRGTAQCLALGPIDRSPVESQLRLGEVVPVNGAAEQLHPGHRHVDATVVVCAAGLQNDNLVAGIGAEPLGEHRSGRPGAHHNVVAHSHRVVCESVRIDQLFFLCDGLKRVATAWGVQGTRESWIRGGRAHRAPPDDRHRLA